MRYGSVHSVVGIRKRETTVAHMCTHLYAVQPMILQPLAAGSMFVVFISGHTDWVLFVLTPIHYFCTMSYFVCMYAWVCACVCTRVIVFAQVLMHFLWQVRCKQCLCHLMPLLGSHTTAAHCNHAHFYLIWSDYAVKQLLHACYCVRIPEPSCV